MTLLLTSPKLRITRPLKLALVIVPVPAVAVPRIHFAVRKLWDNMLVLYGAAAGVVIVILLVVAAACTELRRLPVLHDDRPPGP